MPANLTNVYTYHTHFVAIPTAIITVPAGAAGYVDTDVSATTGVDQTKIWAVAAYKAAGSGQGGARPHGSAVDNRVTLNNTGHLYTQVSSLGHVDLLRDAGGDIEYQIFGYFK